MKTYTVVFRGVTLPTFEDDTYDDLIYRLISYVQQGEFSTVDIQEETSGD